jgi:phage replication O-like protein O
MSRPQLEDGYVRIANELLEAIIRAPLSKRELMIVLAVVRKTYGYGKKTDDISLSQLAQMTGVDRSNVSRAINDLAAAGVLSKRQGRYGQVLGLDKNYQKWAVAKSATRCQNDNRAVAKTTTELLPKQQPQKTTPKDNSKRSPVYFDEFWSAYPKKTGRKPSLKKWTDRNLDSIATKIIDNVQARVASGEWNNVQYVPNPLTYINQDRWDDEVTMNKYNADGMAMTLEDAL